MALIKLASLSYNERRRIEARQKIGAMGKYIDSEGYYCFDDEELKKYKPKKSGRPIKIN